MALALIYAEYEISAGWVYPIMRAIEQREVLKSHLPAWRDGRLSDLVFSIETRLGVLVTARELLSENLQVVAPA
jgi:hypothetical protein